MNNSITMSIRHGKLIKQAAFILIISLFLFVTWASHAPIESATIATGFIRAEGESRRVEHIDGGSIARIYAINGQQVEFGESIIQLDKSELEFSLTAKLNEYLIAIAQKEKATALISEQKTIHFSSETKALAELLNSNYILTSQAKDFNIRRQSLLERRSILRSRIQQVDLSISAEKVNHAALNEIYALTNTQFRSLNSLADRNFVARQKVVDLEKEVVEIKSRLASGNKLIEEKEIILQQLQLELKHLTTEERKQATLTLERIEQITPGLQGNIKRHKQLIEASVIRAPVAGIITHMQVTSPGETVRAGEEIFKILPQQEKLVVEAHLNTKDIENIKKGQRARVRLTAYNQRNTPLINARISKISADRIEGEIGHYFEVELKLDKNEIENQPGIKISAGMPAESIIINNKRTVIDYLLAPLYRGISRSMREG